MSFTQQEVVALLQTLPLTKQQAINASDLANALGYNPAPNQEKLRALIRFAINTGELIGSSNKGYWRISDRQELEEVLDSLEQRAQGTCDRRNNLIDNWNNQFQNQANRVPKDIL